MNAVVKLDAAACAACPALGRDQTCLAGHNETSREAPMDRRRGHAPRTLTPTNRQRISRS